MPTSSPLARIAELQASIEELKKTATVELKEQRVQLAQELHEVDAELARLTGKSSESKFRRKRSEIVGRSPSLSDLKSLLMGAPDETLNLRKEGLDVGHVKQLVAQNPKLLKIGGRGPWPTDVGEVALPVQDIS